MVAYSIKDLENLTGIKAHTIRVWEKRYGIIEPRRNDSNVRYYLEDDVKNIMNIALLNRNGYKISKIAQLNSASIHSIAAQLTDVDRTFENQLDGLTLSMLELNEDHFLKIFNANICQNGFKKTMLEVIYPLLDKLGMMWMTGSVKPIHENFVFQLIKRKCIVELDKLEVQTSAPKKFLMFLPEGENNELSFLFLHYIIKHRGHKVVDLGTNVNIDDIFNGGLLCQPDYILTLIDKTMNTGTYSGYIEVLTANTGESKLLLSGLQVLKHKYKNAPKIQTFQTSEELDTLLRSWEDEKTLQSYGEKNR
ncbi:MAG: MerR family transcriptional regulator [Saprospiraceae bacterium]